MMKLQTIIDIPKSGIGLEAGEKILLLGSCFADTIGSKMRAAGLDVCVNPFGTLYNAASILASLQRLESSLEFTEDDCVEMGAGAGLICSFSHHTSFARKTVDEFLANANSSLRAASAFYRECSKVILTFGTSWAYIHDDKVVSNCLKRPQQEFCREMLDAEGMAELYEDFIAKSGKRFILTVSPIRHLADGAHGNQVSKASLLMMADCLTDWQPELVDYFPSYEIMMDELRDYRFYAEDMVHPSSQAVQYIWERFQDCMFSEEDRKKIAEGEKTFRHSQHRKMLDI